MIQTNLSNYELGPATLKDRSFLTGSFSVGTTVGERTLELIDTLTKDILLYVYLPVLYRRPQPNFGDLDEVQLAALDDHLKNIRPLTEAQIRERRRILARATARFSRG